MTLTQRQEIAISREELLGVLLIIGFLVTIMLTIITDRDQYIPQTTKNKEQLLGMEKQSNQHNGVCLEYRLSQHSTKSEDVFRDNEVRLSVKYDEWIQKLDYYDAVQANNHGGGRGSHNAFKY